MFQIRHNNEAVLIKTLDGFAADLWKKKIIDGSFATPFVTNFGLAESNPIMTSWYSVLGWHISYYKCKSWDEVRWHITNLSGCNSLNVKNNKFISPFIDLIDLFERLGTIPLGW